MYVENTGSLSVLTAYSDDYDDESAGFHGDAFLENGRRGVRFPSLWQAVRWADDHSEDILEMCLCFRSVGGEQKFIRLQRK